MVESVENKIALFLGAVMEYNQTERRWKFPLFIPHYPAYQVDGTLRAASAAVIHADYAKILVTGGSDILPGTESKNPIKVSRAVKLAELMMEFGVPEDKIIVIGQIDRSTTKGNLADIADYLRVNNSINTLLIVCPRFQMMRSREMFVILSELVDRGIKIRWKTAEKIMEEADPRFVHLYSRRVYQTGPALYCAQIERKGRVNLKTGSYSEVNLSERPVFDNLGDLNSEFEKVIGESLESIKGLR